MAKTILICIFLLALHVGASPTSRRVTLISSDGEAFDIDEAVASESHTIKDVLASAGDDGGVGIPLPFVTGEILAKVIEYSEKHVQLREIRDNITYRVMETRRWDDKFVTVVDNCTLFRLFLASKHLRMGGLLNLAYRNVFDRVFRPMGLSLVSSGKSCWSVYSCVPSGGWVLVPELAEGGEDDKQGGCQDSSGSKE